MHVPSPRTRKAPAAGFLETVGLGLRETVREETGELHRRRKQRMQISGGREPEPFPGKANRQRWPEDKV